MAANGITDGGARPVPRLGTRKRRWKEEGIRVSFLLCAAVSIATTVGIVIALLQPAIEFFREINGEEGASRADYNATEDDNVIVQAVAGDKGALGYFGYTYYEQNQDTLNALEIDGGNGCVAPSPEAAQDGSYTPLSRPLFIYVKKDSLSKPEVAAFVQYILDENAAITEAALFIPPHAEDLQTSKDTLAAALGG